MSKDMTEKKSNYEQKELNRITEIGQGKADTRRKTLIFPTLTPVFPFVPLNEFPCLFG